MDLRESITNQTNVSLSIANHLFSKQSHQDKNVVFSPLSLQVVLSIIAAGSDGPTRQQLLDFLRFKSTDHLNSFVSHLLSVILKNVTPSHQPCLPFLEAAPPTTPVCLSFANGVWVEQSLTLQSSFKQIVTTDYKATLASVDFQNKADEVTNEVNLWVEKETNGLIKEILPQGSVHNLTRLIFANALYFKGVWDYPFFDQETKDYDFHLLNGSSVKVPFMTSKKNQFIRAFNDFKVLRVPYQQGDDQRKFSMYFFLPNAKDGLSALVENVASESELLDHKLPLDKVEVGDFRIPRFNISFELETSDMLKELGVVLPFYGGGLTKLVYDSKVSEELHVSEIFHKSFIKVNENGTEAAAATVVTIELQCARNVPTRLDFVADHPFLFMIREDITGTILFVGLVLNPLAE
ncbi:serpin-ZX-like protein [Trifolium pratense]|uniref:Serpin-ZX-like protein n=2 Tax=Trifolium pratense TaxID=57577 RepID=A0A2K3LBU5_TRIPR|nr:serpin-ZX-like protein [Trifolium pratense]